MNEPTDRTLEEAAEAVADERPLDWGSAAARNPALGKTLEELRRLESLARAHREANASAAGGEARTDEPPTAFTWGTLRVREKLGEGAFGEVWLAFDPALGREVALKLRRETGTTGTRRWLEEGRRLARVRHPNVVTVYGAAEHDGRSGIWTELVRGQTLEQRLAREGRLGAREAALAGSELCAALSAVHAAGVVHGDLTAANVMREGQGSSGPGRLVLMDFGSGHEIAQSAEAIARGTPLACAPEVLRGEAATPRSDLYSLGALLFRLLTGRYPVEASTLEELSRLQTKGERPSLRALRPDLPGELCVAIERALDADPARRFADAGELERALAATLHGGRNGAGRAMPLLWAAAAVGALVVGVVLAQRMRPRPVVPQPVAINPAPAAPTPPTAATRTEPAPPLVVDAQLIRRNGGGSESLSDGATIAVGDRLALEVRCAEPAWVYVLNEDQSGHAYALFPLSGLELTNPLQANQRHRLPGALHGKPFAWQVTTNGGEERFLLVVARHRLPLVETQLAALEGARPSSGNDALAGNVDTPRGVGAMVEDNPDATSSAGGPLERMARRLEGSGDAGVWVRVLRLEHPSP